MFDETHHILYGKDTSCHKCSGVAVWVFNGSMVGNYHYCRACKCETGPFAKSPVPPAPTEQPGIWFPTIDFLNLDFSNLVIGSGSITKRKGHSAIQIDTAIETQDRMDQLFFDFMKPPSADHPV